MYIRMKKLRKNRKFYFVPGILILFVVVLVMSFSLKANAKENKDINKKMYTSIVIESGDTLWSIAQENKPDDVTVTEYIHALRNMNGLNNDEIHAGNYLTIYYYAN